MPEAIGFESRGHRPLFDHSIVFLLGFGRRDVADGLEQSAVVEPVDPFERGVFDGLERSPGSAAMDHFGLLKAIDRLGQSVVIAVTDASDRRLDTCLREPFGVSDGEVLGGLNWSSQQSVC